MSGLNIETQGEYPRLWKLGLIQSRIRERANHRCEQCGMEFQPGSNVAVSALRKDGQPMIGTVHHIDGNKANCCRRNLVYLCQSCHYKLHIFGWVPGEVLPLAWRNQPPDWIIRRGLPYQLNPQSLLFAHLPLFDNSIEITERESHESAK